ncbi:MAG: hypothetical protein Q8S73_38610 [Deltaproteobacteria bacterium]|nr:hypothetical protein [Myxococcales bacterium]MDP3220077.1 hypothetical protein [Deltaproteobacteria bacterium]
MTPRRGGRALAAALLAGATAALADPPHGTLPAAPWTRVDPIPLGGSGVNAPIRLPDGRLAIFTRAPSSLVLVDPETGATRSSPVEEPPSTEFAPRCDRSGRLVVLGAGRTLFRLGIDGRVRVAAHLPGALHGLVERPDGTEVAVVSDQHSLSFVTLRPDGGIASVRSIAADPRTAPATLADGHVAVGVPRGLAVFEPAGTIRLVPGVENPGHLITVRDATLAAAERAVFPLDADGVPQPPRPLPGAIREWSASRDGGAFAWTVGTPAALLRIDATGAFRRIDAPDFAVWAMVDDVGAMLLVSRDGRLVALEPDGSRRWVVDLQRGAQGQRGIVPQVTPGDRGDAWITTVDGELLHLWSPPTSSQEAPRANR